MTTKDTQSPIQFDGHCAFALSVGKMNVKGGTHSSIVANKTYVFSNPIAKILFKILPNQEQKAHKNWENK